MMIFQSFVSLPDGISYKYHRWIGLKLQELWFMVLVTKEMWVNSQSIGFEGKN